MYCTYILICTGVTCKAVNSRNPQAIGLLTNGCRIPTSNIVNIDDMDYCF
jgi:hypothetical protein